MKAIKNIKIQRALISSFTPSDMMAIVGRGRSYRAMNKIFKRLKHHYGMSLDRAYLEEVAYCKAMDI